MKSRLATALLLSALASCDSDSSVGACSVEELPLADRRLTDLIVLQDVPGKRSEALPLGHTGGGKADRSVMLHNGIWTTGSTVLPYARDRHSCTILGKDEPGTERPFCIAGGKQGQAGGDPNRLYERKDGQDFRLADIPETAKLPTLRSRLIRTLEPGSATDARLLITVWGKRNDDGFNESFVGRLTDSEFRIEQILPHRAGGRCVAIADVNDDGFDDFALCGEEEGAELWL